MLLYYICNWFKSLTTDCVVGTLFGAMAMVYPIRIQSKENDKELDDSSYAIPLHLYIIDHKRRQLGRDAEFVTIFPLEHISLCPRRLLLTTIT